MRRGGLGLAAAVAVVVAAAPAALASSATAPDWTKQAPATSPPTRQLASVAYDAATRDVVLFGGGTFKAVLDDTWTWGSPG